ncbi:protein translocase subunit secF [Humidesulfovibrio mexicanus]|uniref:Protein-export membrane protein SecF n=1 Tax=Humidesulfovibrio mexicanus TaxID=147047 RepID=A0A239CZB2_9BACT|nr:protein translocase subunit SecF [Humidesulfovibrio mexicanus]SNS25565.1 protein translocase subunit secF [Humidesulfovibrio mexicanus]
MSFHIIKPGTNINFIGLRYYAFALSALMIIVGMVSLGLKGGPRYGIDFAGGVVIQAQFDAPTKLDDLKKTLEGTGLPGLVVQQMGQEKDNDFLIRTSISEGGSESVQKVVTTAISTEMGGVVPNYKRIEMVGPKVGEDLRGKALEAMYFAILLIAIYISGRFEHRWMAAGIMAAGLFGGIWALQYFHAPQMWLVLGALIITLVLCFLLKLNYALGAIVALIHDVLVTVGLFSIMNKEFDLTIIAALLTLIGFSLNDTIVVFDRIRELRGQKTGEPLSVIINNSVNQTLSRTVLTSGLACVAVGSLYLFGGQVIHDFALAMLIGVIVGTYSSVYVAAPIIVSLTPPDEDAGAAPLKAKTKIRMDPNGVV